MKPTTLSSNNTFFRKVIYSPLAIGALVIGTLMLWCGVDADDVAMKWIFSFLTLLGVPFVWVSCARIKRVRIDDQFLYISNYVDEYPVDLKTVDRVTQNRFLGLVTICFDCPTAFGRSVSFPPLPSIANFLGQSPAVVEINRRAQQAKTPREQAVSPQSTDSSTEP